VVKVLEGKIVPVFVVRPGASDLGNAATPGVIANWALRTIGIRAVVMPPVVNQNIVIDHTVVVYASRIVGSHQNARFSVLKRDIVYEHHLRGAVPGGDSFGFVAVDDIIPNACREAADVWRRRIFHVNAVLGLASMRIQI